MSDKWTEPQKQVIKHSAGNLLVSASAGSGKTSVLIEKIVTLILSEKVHLKNMLVVTFTNAASLEIKQRLQNALSQSNNNFLITELEDLSTSDILTFDSFCIKMVKEFGYEIGQSSNFSVADTSLAGFLQNQALDNLLSRHGKNIDSKFTNVLDTFFGGRNDKAFRSGIISLYNFLRSKDDDAIYRQKLDEMFNLDEDICNNQALNFLNNYILNIKNNFYQKLSYLYTLSKTYDDKKVTSALLNAMQFTNLLSDDFLKNLTILQNNIDFEMPKSSKKDIVEIYEIKQQFLAAKKEFLADIDFVFSKEIKSLTFSQIKDDIKSTKQRLSYLFELVSEFDAEYKKLKVNMQVLDFVDIEQCASKILNNKEIALALQNRYDWIFIDEYQDTSMLQEGIVKKITTGQNLFMVGDFKQSIYRFRQAEPKIFINKYNQYKKMQNLGSVIELKTNFRSASSILNFNNFVFDNIYKQQIDDFEYRGNADLEFGGSYNDNNHESKVKIFIIDEKDETDDDHSNSTQNISKDNLSVYSVKNSEISHDKTDDITKEALLLASQIKDMLNRTYYDAKTGCYKQIRFCDIAVLSRNKNSALPKIRKVLNEVGIPVTTTYEDTLFENYDMQILLNIIKAIQNPNNDLSLISSLTNIGDVSLDELAIIRQKFREEEFFYNAAKSYRDKFCDILSQKLNNFFDKIKRYQSYSTYKDICELIDKIVENENLDTYFAINNFGDEFESHLSLLKTNIQSIKKYTLFEFVNFIDTFGTELKFDNTIKDAENAVTLSTIHKSKGLEYPVVFLIGGAKPFNIKSESEKLLMDNDWGICMPSYDLANHKAYDNLLQKAFKLKIKSENKKENKRLLYVALTRPKNYLTIIGTMDAQKIKPLKSEFDIYNANSYLQWILGCLSQDEIDSLAKNKQLLKQLKTSDDKSNQSILEITNIKDSEFYFDSQNLSNIKPDKISVDKDKFLNILSYKFSQNDLAKKNTVTQIMSEEEHYNISNFNYTKNDRYDDEDFLSIGNAYHKYMELLNFTLDEENIKKQILELKNKNKISIQESLLVDENKIIKAIKQVSSLINYQDTVSKEKQFLAYMPANDLVDTEKQNKILIQGVADLIIIKEKEIYLIDYKTSRLKEQDFAKKYSTQLKIYAKAIEEFYNKPVSKKYIYSFHLNKLIII